jgi:diacylglycerol kinase family enzyme
MPGLSRLADRGLLWIGLAAALRATGDRQARRAAWRGLGSMAAASTAANLVGKSLTSRRRPFLDVPARSRLRRVPRSSSFPSGHAANAAAFVTGAAIEMPSLAAPGIALASAVGASRIATGVHYPSDILAGTAIGAAAGLATLWWWPRRPPQPAAAIRPPRTAPASAAGEGLALIVNTAAGTASTRLARRLAADLPEATIIETSAGEDLAARLRDAAADARILGVVGGDGTVSAAAAVAVETDLPLLVIPAGTFNHFAADLGVEGARDALAALRDGEAVAVDLALAGSRPFVNTSSTGVYVDMVNARRQLERVLGRRLAEVVALIGVLRHGRPHELVLDGRRCRLWLYFAGNCQYEPPGMAPAYRPDLADGWLDIRVVEAAVLARSRLVAAVLTGTLGRSRVYRSWRARSVDIRAAGGKRIWLSTDGEVATAESGFIHGKHPRRLVIYRR